MNIIELTILSNGTRSFVLCTAATYVSPVAPNMQTKPRAGFRKGYIHDAILRRPKSSPQLAMKTCRALVDARLGGSDEGYTR
jgi:hypothetical protein